MVTWWPLLAAVLSFMTTGRCDLRTIRIRFLVDTQFATWAAFVAHHAVLGSLVLGGLFAEAETGFVCAVIVASTPRTSHFEVAACLVVLFARLYVSGGWAAAYVWLPAFLFIQKICCSNQPGLSHSNSAVSTDVAGFTGVPSQTVRGVDKIVKRFPSWVPPTQVEIQQWTMAFHLNDKLLAVYACTVQLRVAHRGYLYLSTDHLCFQATGFGRCYLHLSLALSDIQEVRDEEGQNGSKLVLQRPIEVEDSSEPFPTTMVEVRDCAAGQVAIASLVRRRQGNEEEDDFSETEDTTDRTSNASASIPDTIHEVRRPSGHQIVTSFSEGEAFRHLLEVHVPGLELTTVREDVFSDEWNKGSLIFDHYGGLGAWHVAVGPWIDDSTEACGVAGCGDRPRLRELSMELPVPPAPMCPKATRQTVTMCLLVSRSSDTPSLTLLCTTVSHDMPFGDKFVVQEKIELVPLESGEGVRFCKHGRVVFLKSCGILNSRISSSTAAELTRTGEKLAALLKQRAAPSLDQSVPSGKVTFVVHIWELQRRVTVWSKSWKPPFLPHDGRKRWRWVDPAYQVHAWMSAESREAAAASTIPPIEPWQGYKMLKPWQVSCTSSGAHDDGWQYAIDFYQQDKFWRGAASGCHVRRRLWTCTFVEA
mmetsp:Transcript_9353/g.17890  ORF Transcript_9353/g.17890 Transcript_9353/m.17890 type:complete len:647 (-) Transcript_9353:61-2001(-)